MCVLSSIYEPVPNCPYACLSFLFLDHSAFTHQFSFHIHPFSLISVFGCALVCLFSRLVFVVVYLVIIFLATSSTSLLLFFLCVCMCVISTCLPSCHCQFSINLYSSNFRTAPTIFPQFPCVCVLFIYLCIYVPAFVNSPSISIFPSSNSLIARTKFPSSFIFPRTSIPRRAASVIVIPRTIILPEVLFCS